MYRHHIKVRLSPTIDVLFIIKDISQRMSSVKNFVNVLNHHIKINEIINKIIVMIYVDDKLL